VLLYFFVLLFYGRSCCFCAEQKGNDHRLPPVESGDLVFRNGTGQWSRYFRDVSLREKRFSHAGIIRVETNAAFVIHASADDRTGAGFVHQEPLHSFINPYDDVAIYRVTDAAKSDREQIAVFAVKNLGKLFDAQFDLTSGERYYCTELIRDAVAFALKTNMIKTTAVSGYEIIAIDDCYAGDWVFLIYDSRAATVP